MDQITGFGTSLGTYHSMPRKKRAHTGNLGSVATVTTDVFQINGFSVRNKIGKMAKIFGKIEDPENRGVI